METVKFHQGGTLNRGRFSGSVYEEPVEVADPLEGYLNLRELFGLSSVFLLESCAGPKIDTRLSFIGFTAPLEITVHRSVVSISGLPHLVNAVIGRLLERGVTVRSTDGSLRLGDSEAFWDLPRVASDIFDVPCDSRSFGFGFLAFYGYDTVHYIEEIPYTIRPRRESVPDVTYTLVHGLVTLNMTNRQGVLSTVQMSALPPLPVDEIKKALKRSSFGKYSVSVPSRFAVNVTDEISSGDYLGRIDRCLEYIRVGDIYQVQIGHEMRILSAIDPVEVYRRLRRNNPSPYMVLLPIGDAIVVGASPEVFVRVDCGKVLMRPIAGTVRRTPGRGTESDLIESFLQDPKECAEHVMLVDLCRDDLSKFAARSSVEVDDLMSLERFSHLFHIVSTVSAKLPGSCDIYDVIRACFPAGTMTGAPKVRAMEIIEEQELSRRGLYAGAFGLIGLGGWAELSLAIRVAVLTGGTYVLRASAGVVSDSCRESEWSETLTKLSATYLAITGEELA